MKTTLTFDHQEVMSWNQWEKVNASSSREIIWEISERILFLSYSRKSLAFLYVPAQSFIPISSYNNTWINLRKKNRIIGKTFCNNACLRNALKLVYTSFWYPYLYYLNIACGLLIILLNVKIFYKSITKYNLNFLIISS